MIRTKEDLRRYMEADKRMLERGGVVPVLWITSGSSSGCCAGLSTGTWVLNPAQRLRQRAQHRTRWPYRRQPLCAHR